MRVCTTVLKVLVTLLVLPTVCLATTQKEPSNLKANHFYDAPTKEGWWWYKDPTKTKEPEGKQQNEQDVDRKPQQKDSVVKPLSEYKYEELLRMHPDEFKKIYDYYLKLAVQDPTEENVYNFYNIQDVARKKAALFAAVSGYIWQKYPELSTERDVPVVGPGAFQHFMTVRQEVKDYARLNATEYGFVVFVSPDCPFCDAQLRILNHAKSDGIEVKVVDISKTPSAVSVFGVEVTPTIIIVDRKTGQYMPISAGVISLDEIYTRASKAIRVLRGDSPERYGIYEFQRGTSLDPLEPPPLWKNKDKR